MIGTIGRLYIWKNFGTTQLSADTDFASKFFKLGGCTVAIPCEFCSLEYVSNVTLCSTDGNPSPYLANWDFDIDNTQYVMD